MPTIVPPGTPQGPNVNPYDHTPDISVDPFFAGWDNPVPQWWFLSQLDYANLTAPGASPTNEFSHFYQTYVEETLTTSDSAGSKKETTRQGVETLYTSDSAARGAIYGRDESDTLTTSDSAEATLVNFGQIADLVRPIVTPVEDADE